MKVFTNKKKMRGYREFLYILPFIILVAIFAYYPLYGWAYAFFDYKPPKALSMDDFVGLKWFRYLVDNPVRIKQTLMVLRNTFAMSGLTILFSWLPMIFAVFLNEIKCMPFRKFVQTVTTLPNFISWVLVFSICYCMFNSTGMANSLLIQMGVLEKPIAFLQSSNHIWLKMWLWSTWKSLDGQQSCISQQSQGLMQNYMRQQSGRGNKNATDLEYYDSELTANILCIINA